MCTVNETELQWKIDFSKDFDDIQNVRYFSDDMTGITSRLDVVTNRATSYTFYLTSTTPLTSTMIANVSQDLDGGTVICQDGFTDAALEDRMSLRGETRLSIFLYSYIYTIASSPGPSHVFNVARRTC
jgi:hypothetical protein